MRIDVLTLFPEIFTGYLSQSVLKRAIVAVARRMAVIMHRIWADGTEFRWTRPTAEAV